MFVFFLFHCCWLLSYVISFYAINTCLFSFWNKPPFERNLFYVKVSFNLYLYYHLIIHSLMHRHAHFVGELAFSSGVTFRASYFVFMSIRLLMVDPGKDLRRPKEISHWNDFVVLRKATWKFIAMSYKWWLLPCFCNLYHPQIFEVTTSFK